MEQVHHALLTQSVVLLVGAPGVGKSALARAHAYATRERGDEVCWVRLVGVREPEQARAMIHDALRALEAPDTTHPGHTVEQTLSLHTQLLLVLDGAEGVLSALAATWALWWQDRPVHSLRVLVTTRQDPRLLHATLLPVGPLRVTADVAEPHAPGVAWFLHCAQRRGWALDASDSSTLAEVERLVVLLGGIPTAIELAASRGRIMGLSSLRTYIEQDLSILEARLCDVSSRQHNFTHMLQQNWEQLDRSARHTLSLCSAFYTPFRIEEFAAIADMPFAQALSQIEELVGQGLVQAHSWRDGVVCSVLDVMRRFVQRTPDYEAQSERILDEARALSVCAASELLDCDMLVDLDDTHVEAWLKLAGEVHVPHEVATLLTLVFRHALTLDRMYHAHHIVEQRERSEWPDSLLDLASRFEQLYMESRARALTDESEGFDVSLDGLDPLASCPADPYGARLRRASLLMQAEQLDEAHSLLEEMRRGWGARKEGARACQLDLLVMEHLLRERHFAMARRLVRARYIALRHHPEDPLWDSFVAAALLLDLLGVLEQPMFHPRRLQMTWQASGLHISDESWSPVLKTQSYLGALSGLLDWVSGTPPHTLPAQEEDSHQARMVDLLMWVLQARMQASQPDMQDFYALANTWRAHQSGVVSWFELLVAEAIEACLRHEKLHSVATQLQDTGTLVTIDMQSLRFRVADASWVSFGHRPKAKLLIERMIMRDEHGDFLSVQAGDLISHIWPDERMRYDSALARLYNLIANIRRLGLDDVLVHEKDGYCFGESCVVQVLPGGE